MSPFENIAIILHTKTSHMKADVNVFLERNTIKKYKNAKQASKHVTTVAVKVWTSRRKKVYTKILFNSKQRNCTIGKEMFKEIYKSKERFPIHEMGCYNWRGNSSTSEHCLGLAFDINSNENYMIDGKKVLAGSFGNQKEKQIFHTIKLQIGKNIRKIRF